MKFERDDARVGLMVFGALALFCALVFQRSISALFKKETSLNVRLQEVTDLTVGTEVQIQGLRVGQVNAIQLEREGVRYSFLAKLGMRPDIVIWKETKGVVVSKTLGGAYLDLLLPEPEKRTEPLQAVSEIKGETGASLASLIEDMQSFVCNLDETLSDMRQRGLGALFDHPRMRATLGEVQETLKAFRGLANEGQVLARHGNESMKLLDSGLEDLDKSLSVIRKLMDSRSGDMDSIIQHLAGIMKELEAVSGQVRELLKDSGPEAGETLRTLHRDLKSTEEILELLKAKPSRIVWGKPSEKEKEAALKRVEEARRHDAQNK